MFYKYKLILINIITNLVIFYILVNIIAKVILFYLSYNLFYLFLCGIVYLNPNLGSSTLLKVYVPIPESSLGSL